MTAQQITSKEAAEAIEAIEMKRRADALVSRLYDIQREIDNMRSEFADSAVQGAMAKMVASMLKRDIQSAASAVNSLSSQISLGASDLETRTASAMKDEAAWSDFSSWLIGQAEREAAK